MPSSGVGSASVSTATLVGFPLVLARVSSVFIFLPIPGFRNGSDSARVFLVLAVVATMVPFWPRPPHMEQSIATLSVAIFSESAFGLTIGLCMSFVMEVLLMAAQVAGLQAGYGYASTIDPTTQSDSGVLLVVAQMLAGLLFLATGLDREMIRIFVGSLQTFPPGQFVLSTGIVEAVIRLGSGMLSMGVRLALPMVALLGLIDLSLALLGRLNAQLQLITLAFPVKMLSALLLFGWLVALSPRIFGAYANQAVQLVRSIAGAR
jgi:flagellar biosynthetic protein FliR